MGSNASEILGPELSYLAEKLGFKGEVGFKEFKGAVEGSTGFEDGDVKVYVDEKD